MIPEQLSFFEQPLKDEIEKSAEIRSFSAGTVIIEPDQYIRHIPLLISGSIKVFREDEEGNELLLYTIEAGESCAMTLTCSSNERTSKIKAIALENTEALMIPVRNMDEWMRTYRTWYYFVLGTYRRRFDELLLTIDDIAFRNMDERLENYLKKMAAANGTSVLNLTHQTIAGELNSSREVISRLLKKMEQRGLITLGRNEIILKNLKP